MANWHNARALAVRLSPAVRARFERLAKRYGGRQAALVAGLDALERIEKERWRRVRPFQIADDRDAPAPPPDRDAPVLEGPDGRGEARPSADPVASPPTSPAYHGTVRVRKGAVVVGQRIPWYANAYDFVQNYAAEITVVSLGRPFGDPPQQVLYYQISQIDTAPGNVKPGDLIRLDGGYVVRVTRLNAAVVHAGRPVVPASVAPADEPADRADTVTQYQIERAKDALPCRRAPTPAPYQRSFKEEVAIPDLLDDLTVAPAAVRPDVLAVFDLADRAADATTSRAFMANVKAIWTEEERAAFRRIKSYRIKVMWEARCPASSDAPAGTASAPV